MVNLESWTHIKIIATLLATGLGTVAGGGMWVTSVNTQVENNKTAIERNTEALEPLKDVTTRMDERQQEIQRTLTRIERLLENQ